MGRPLRRFRAVFPNRVSVNARDTGVDSTVHSLAFAAFPVMCECFLGKYGPVRHNFATTICGGHLSLSTQNLHRITPRNQNVRAPFTVASGQSRKAAANISIASHVFPWHFCDHGNGHEGATRPRKAKQASYRHPLPTQDPARVRAAPPPGGAPGRTKPRTGPQRWERGRRIGRWQRPGPPFPFRATGKAGQVKEGLAGGAQVQRLRGR